MDSSDDQDARDTAVRPTEPDDLDGGQPSGTTYTVQFPDGDGYTGADLEYPAPLPSVGDVVEYIDERGRVRRFRVREVVHTLQSSAAQRPRVADGDASPDAIARPGHGEMAERPGETGLVRAGLPRVMLEALD